MRIKPTGTILETQLFWDWQPLAIDIYPSGVAVRVSSGTASGGNLVFDPLTTWTELISHLSRTEKKADETMADAEAAEAPVPAVDATAQAPRNLTLVGRDVVTLLLHAPLIFSGAACESDIYGLRLLPTLVREAAAFSIVRPSDADAARHAVEVFATFFADKAQSEGFTQLAVPHILGDIEAQIGTDNFRSAILGVPNDQWAAGARPTAPNLVERKLNLATVVLLATELRCYPRSISLDPIALVNFRRSRANLWALHEPIGALDGILAPACMPEEVKRKIQACIAPPAESEVATLPNKRGKP